MNKFSADAPETAERLAGMLKTPGTVLLVPTETVYGLVARAGDAQALEKIDRLKHRKAGKFFGWFVGSWQQISRYGLVGNDLADRLAERYFPGPLTLILGTVSGSTQAVRIPDHPLLTALLSQVDVPLVQTSANLSGSPDALSLEDALKQLDGEVDAAVDGGAIPPGSCGSTVVDTVNRKILRQGSLVIGTDLLV